MLLRRIVEISPAKSAENMPTYIHELEGWPRFHWSSQDIAEKLAAVRHRQGLSIRVLLRVIGDSWNGRCEPLKDLHSSSAGFSHAV